MIEQEERREISTADVPQEETPKVQRVKRKRPVRAFVPRRPLPQFRVVLHNDDINDMVYVVRTIVSLTPLDRSRATLVMLHAQHHGLALVLITHKERAELYQAQFRSKGLLVTVEPDA
jgi:ATP-dependent Clp protease adaptor protein ClpS